MTTKISTKTTGVGGLEVTGDASGVLELASANGTTALTIDASQNVGIGTSSPASRLDISSSLNAGQLSPLTFSGDNSVSAKTNYVQFVPSIEFNPTGIEAGGFTLKALQGGAYKNIIVASGTVANSSNYLALGTTNEALRINSSGNVGIGTSSPSGRLEVAGGRSFFAASNEFFAVGARYSAGGGAVYFGATDSTATPGVQISAATGVALLNITTSGNVGIGTSSPGYKLDMTGQGRATTGWAVSGDGSAFTPSGLNAIPNYGIGYITSGNLVPLAGFSGIPFYTNQLERMRIDSSGNVGIGTASPTSTLHVKSANPIFRLETTGTVTSGGTAYNTIRDSTGSDVFLNGFAGLSNCYQFATTFTNGFIRFLTGSQVEAMRIDSSGNLLFNSGYGSAATAYGCRAWVNFNGTGTVAIRASGNVSSITDNGTGDYTVNFATALPDANYCTQATGQRANSNNAMGGAITFNRTPTTTGSPVAFVEDSGSLQDPSICAVAIFR